MNVLIIEDEKPAAEKLKLLLNKYNSEIEIVKIITDVASSVKWLSENEDTIDIIFMDIQLTDGNSFEIFDQVSIKKPVIFTTAYDEYAIDAFKVNSIDYLLKPISYDALVKSLDKFSEFPELFPSKKKQIDFESIANALSSIKKDYKNRFMVRLGEHIHSILVGDIAMFYSEGRTVFLLTNENRKFIIDYKMEELENLLDPAVFNRVNRSFIVSINSVADVIVFSKSRYKIEINPDFDKEIFVSREKMKNFKDWFEGGI